MKQWLKGIALCLAIILFCSVAVSGSTSALPSSTAPSAPLLSTTPSLPTDPPTEPPTDPPTEPPTEPPTDPPTEPPTETPTEAPTTPPPTDPPASQVVTIGNPVSGISAKKAFVYDFGSQSYLYMKGEADAKLYPASITKLMNAYTALHILELDTVLTVGQDVLDITPFDTSLAGLRVGDQLTFKTALQAMLVPSGSDAAHVIAVAAGRALAEDPGLDAQAAEDRFVEEMNRQVSLLGLVNTHFVHADGYHDYSHYTCMADLTTIAATCLDTPQIRDTVKRSTVTLEFLNRDAVRATSTNLMLHSRNPYYYHKETRGLKTGTTDDAGCCLLGAFWVQERYVLVGVFQCSANNIRYNNANKLFNTFCGPNAPALPAVSPGEDTTEATEETQPTVPTDAAQLT